LSSFVQNSIQKAIKDMMLDPRVLTLNLEQMLSGEEANKGTKGRCWRHRLATDTSSFMNRDEVNRRHQNPDPAGKEYREERYRK
jgi:hypothetical protein